MKKIIAFTLSLVIAFSGVYFIGSPVKEVKAADSWVLEWSDEFDGTSLNTNNWTCEIGTGSWGWGNNEHQYYTNRKENVEVSNGTLKIKALKENYNGSEYTSARLITRDKQEFKYGKIEARIKLPSYTGAWPAFWTLGANGGWPKCGEIDIMEAINAENNTYGYVHWHVESADYTGQGDTGGTSAGKLPTGYQRTEWHTYGIEWDEKQIKFYVDDKVFRTVGITADHMSEFRQDHYIILNQAVGGQWPGHTIDDSAFPSRSVMEVDYVRVYQKEEEPTTPYDGPTITVTQDAVAEYTGSLTQFFTNADGWTNTSGSVTPAATIAEGFTTNITSAGNINSDSVWGVQTNIEGITYYPGATYTYKCTLTSNVDKKVYVKVADENEENLAGGLIDLKAGEPYEYETTVTIPEDYTGKLSLKFGMGKTTGDTIEDNSALTINVKDISFVTTTTIPDPNYVPPTTEKPPVEDNTTYDGTDSGEEGTTLNKITTLKRTKVRKATKKKSSKKIKLSIKRIKDARGYQVAVYKTLKNAKKNKKAIYKKFVRKIRPTITSKKFKKSKKLYVKVRAYKLNGKKKVYAKKWSKIKKVRNYK